MYVYGKNNHLSSPNMNCRSFINRNHVYDTIYSGIETIINRLIDNNGTI